MFPINVSFGLIGQIILAQFTQSPKIIGMYDKCVRNMFLLEKT